MNHHVIVCCRQNRPVLLVSSSSQMHKNAYSHMNMVTLYEPAYFRCEDTSRHTHVLRHVHSILLNARVCGAAPIFIRNGMFFLASQRSSYSTLFLQRHLLRHLIHLIQRGTRPYAHKALFPVSSIFQFVHRASH